MQRVGRLIFMLVAVATSCYFISPSAVWAQAGATSTSVYGVITDESGQAISGVTFTVVQDKINVTRDATTDENGTYQIGQLPPGHYKVMVKAEGFSTRVFDIDLDLGTTLVVNVAMKVGGVSDVVEVKADSSTQVKTESSTNIDRQRIDNLPINRRNFLDFALTTPRVTADRTPASEGVVGSSGLSFNGQSGRSNNVTIDGLDNNNLLAGSVRTTFSQDAVQEFQVISDGYSAEFGRASAGIINIVTRGGTNELHGTAFFFDRNDKLAARDPFADFKPRFSQYQAGAAISGPLKKDKAFFFLSAERLSVKQNNIVTIRDETVRVAADEGFLFSNGPRPFGFATTSFLARGDYKVNANDSLFVRYNYGGRYNGKFEDFGGLLSDSITLSERTHDNSVAVTNSYINSGARLVNETRFLYSKRFVQTFDLAAGPEVSLPAPEGSTSFGATGGPIIADEKIAQFVDIVTLSRGRHDFKFGVDGVYRPLSQDFVPFKTGIAIFQPFDFGPVSLSSFQSFDPKLRTPAQRDFLTGLSQGLAMGIPGFPVLPLADLALPVATIQGFGKGLIKTTDVIFAAFAQDDYKPTANLLLKGGVRYDISRDTFFPKNSGNFAPRVGFSYRFTQVPLVMHGSYGIFFATPFIGLDQVVAPTSITQQVNVQLLPFPFSVLSFGQPGHVFPVSTNANPPGVPKIPQFAFEFDYDNSSRNTYSQQANFGFDYALNNNTTLGVNYVYVRGIKIFAEKYSNPVVRPIPGDFVDSILTGRLDPNRGQIILETAASDSYYHGVTFSINHRFSNHYSLFADYTFSKAIDNNTDIRNDIADGPVDPFNLKAERSLSIQDARHRFVASGVWDLDYTKNIFLKGFQLSSIITLESGHPFNLLAGTDLNMNGDVPSFDRPTGVGRNEGVLPGFASVDFRLTRSVVLKESLRLQGFLEVFNAFNRTNIKTVDRLFPPDAQGNFNLPPNTGENGRFIATPDRFRGDFAPRQIQVGVRINF